MTRTGLIRAVARRNQVPLAMAEKVVEVVFGRLEDALCQGRRVEIRGLGSFQVRHYAPRLGRDPRNQAPVPVGHRVRARFRAGKDVLQRINKEELP